MNFLLLMLILMGISCCSVDSGVIYMECDQDSECGTKSYCYLATGQCAPCTVCALYKRAASSWRDCAKEPGHCGPCLPGYEEEIFNDGKTRSMCIPMTVLPPSPHNQSGAQAVYSGLHISWLIGITMFSAVIMFYAFCWRNWKIGRAMVEGRSAHICEPPPYQSNIHLSSTSITETENCNVEEQLELSVLERKAEVLQQAVPFRSPNYESLLGPDTSTCDPLNNEDTASEGESVVSPTNLQLLPSLELEDESTMPCDWTPNLLDTAESQSMEELSEEGNGEPLAKKSRQEEDRTDGPNCTFHISLCISNNVTINKQS